LGAVIVWALFEMSPPKVEQARNLAHEIDPTDAVLLAFIDDYAAYLQPLNTSG
jgi:hypothetical protein